MTAQLYSQARKIRYDLTYRKRSIAGPKKLRPMPEEVSYDNDADLIRIRVWGDDHIEDWISSILPRTGRKKFVPRSWLAKIRSTTSHSSKRLQSIEEKKCACSMTKVKRLVGLENSRMQAAPSDRYLMSKGESI